MAANKLLNSTSFSIEVENGTDKTGAMLYKKKNFSGVRPEATIQNIFEVAEAIKVILNAPTRYYYVNDSS